MLTAGNNGFASSMVESKMMMVEGEYIFGAKITAPEYSICIPTYARPHLLKQAIASAIQQRFEGEWEIIVCENSQDRATLEIVQAANSNRVSLWRNKKNIGMVGNWNQCIALAGAPWITILHDDDLISPWFLSECAAQLKHEIKPSALFGRSMLGSAPPVQWPNPNDNKFTVLPTKAFILNNPISFPGMCLNRQDALKAGGFNAELGMLADYDLWVRLAMLNGILRSSMVLSFYRISPEQCSANAIKTIVNDSRKSRYAQLDQVRCSLIRKRILLYANEILTIDYYSSYLSRPPGLWWRITRRMAALIKSILIRGLDFKQQ